MNFPESKKNFFRTLRVSIAWTVCLAICGGAAAKQPSTVVVVPFETNSDRDLSYLRDGVLDMLSTRLTHPGEVDVVPAEKTKQAVEEATGPWDEGRARNVGNRLGADYVLYGSLAVFEDSVNIDAKVVDMSGMNPPLAFFSRSRDMDEVIPRINEFAARINRELFGKGSDAEPKPAPASEVAPRSARNQTIYAHPEKMWEREMQKAGTTEGDEDSFVGNRPEEDVEKTPEFRKIRNFGFEIKGIAAGDLTGDGQNEIVLMESRKVRVYRHRGGRLAELGEIEGESRHNFLSVDVADVKKDGDGRAEIFVTCLNENTKALDSFVLEWDGSAFDYVSRGEKWYFGVVSRPDSGKILAGQRRGVEELFLPGVYRLSWDGRGYSGADTLPVPAGQLVYGFAMGDSLDEGGDTVVSLNSEGRLKVCTADGGQEWKSDEKYGGSEKFLRHVDAGGRETEDRMFLPQRIFVVDSNDDGENEVLVIKNESFIGGLFKNYKRYGSGTFQAFAWDGPRLAPCWRTPEISGYVSDYILEDMDNDGAKDLIAAVVGRREFLFRDAKSSVVFCDLSALSGTKSAAK